MAEDDYSDDGYVTTKTGDTGTIAKDGTSTAVFTNTKNVTPIDPDPGDPTDPDESADPDIPTGPDKPTDDVSKTGDETNLTLWLVLLGISGMGTIITLLGSKRKYKGKHCKR